LAILSFWGRLAALRILERSHRLLPNRSGHIDIRGIYHLNKEGTQAFMKIVPGVCDPSNSRHISFETGSVFSIGRPFDEACAWLFRNAVLLYSLTNPNLIL
jgi:hypothetical protein